MKSLLLSLALGAALAGCTTYYAPADYPSNVVVTPGATPGTVVIAYPPPDPVVYPAAYGYLYPYYPSWYGGTWLRGDFFCCDGGHRHGHRHGHGHGHRDGGRGHSGHGHR